jgi:murein peptide amidase A
MRVTVAACLLLLSVCCALTAAAAGTSRLGNRVVATLRSSYVLGRSVEGRPIVARMLSGGTDRRSVLVVGSIAGDEPGGIAVTRVLASEPAVAGVRLWLIANMNPDGVARGTRDNAHGVDLNRNFPFHWRHIGLPGSRFYSGSRASSEPESRAIEAFIRRIRPALAIWLHQPYGLVDDSQGPHWAERLVGRLLELPLERLPDYPGSAIGWEDHLVHASAFDVELPSRLSRVNIQRAAAAIRLVAQRDLSAHIARPSMRGRAPTNLSPAGTRSMRSDRFCGTLSRRHGAASVGDRWVKTG